jgi:hypothetical protein
MPDPNIATPPDTSAWIAGGAAVAVETPPAAPEIPAAPPAAAEPPAAAPPASDTPPAPPAEPTPAEQIVQSLVKAGLKPEDAQALLTKASTPAPIKDALEAFLDGKPYPVPKSLTFKLKSGTTVREATLEQLQREGMLATDYQRKTQELAQQRREHAQAVAQWTARDAALKEREKWFQQQRDEMIAAQKDPKKWEEYQEILRLRAANPAFDKLYQDAMKAREDGATKEVLDRAAQEAQVSEGVEQAAQWIQEVAAEFPGVNPERVRFLLSYAWANEQLPYGIEAVRAVYRGEQEYLQTGPAAQEAAALKERIAALEAAQNADKHNEATARALARGKAPNTAPGGGGPAAPGRIVESKPIPPDRRLQEEAISAWTKVRDQ